MTAVAPLELASRWRRLCAAVIDYAVVPTVGVVLVLVTGAYEHAEDYVGYRPFLNGALLALASYAVVNGALLWRRGQTVGKAVLGIALRTPAGAAVPLWRCIARAAFFFSPLLLIHYAGVLVLLDWAFIFGSKRRCLHDRLCATVVVRV